MSSILFLKIFLVNALATGLIMLVIWAFEKSDEKKQNNIIMTLKYLLVSTAALGFGWLMKLIF